MRKLIGFLSVFLALVFISNATGVKTYLYKPQNPQSEIYEIYIDTDGLIYSKNSSAALFRLDSNYILPLASTTARGGVKIGIGLTMTGDSVGVALHAGSGISIGNDTITCDITAGDGLTRTAADIDLDAATTTTIGGVIVNDVGLGISSGTISLDAATTSALGGVIVDDAGLGVAAGTISLDLATADARGGVKVGLGLAMTGDSIGIAFTAGTGLTLTDDDIALDLASASARGGAKIGYGLTMTGDSVGLAISTARVLFDGGDPTPTVAGGSFFCMSPASATIITGFDDGIDGQLITVMGSATSSTFAFSGNLVGSGNSMPLDTGDIATFIYSSAATKWFLTGFNDASANHGF